VFLDEVFQQTHIRKGTSEYVDERSRKTNVSLFYCSKLFTLKCIPPQNNNCSLFTYRKNFRLGFLKSDLRFPHVLMEHKSNPLLIIHRMILSGLGAGLRQ